MRKMNEDRGGRKVVADVERLRTKVQRLADALAEVLLELAPASSTDLGSYDSRHLPPGVASPRAYRERARKILGARRVGRDVVISVADWDQAHAAPPTRKKAAPIDPPAANDTIESILQSRGVRLGGTR